MLIENGRKADRDYIIGERRSKEHIQPKLDEQPGY